MFVNRINSGKRLTYQQAKELELLKDHLFNFEAMSDIIDHMAAIVKDKQIVLMGEATHGSYEFYRIRSLLTQKLILEHDFNTILIEADWPDVYRLNYAFATPESVENSLDQFVRFPLWMWRNEEFLDFVKQLQKIRKSKELFIYGLDLYSMYRSINEIISELNLKNPEMAKNIAKLYECFSLIGKDPNRYGHQAYLGDGCVEEAQAAFNKIMAMRVKDQLSEQDDLLFNIEQNAFLVKNAETYYRLLFDPNINTWNLRDQHMFDCLERVKNNITKNNKQAKIIVWAHNCHIGNAKATDRAFYGEINLGQLVKEQYHEDAYLLGFSTYTGKVIAAHNWGDVAQIRSLRPALDGSYEDLFHQLGVPNFFLPCGELKNVWEQPHLQRAVGVIYRPVTERMSHYFNCQIPYQYDGVIHIDETNALNPLDFYRPHDKTLDTYPFAV